MVKEPREFIIRHFFIVIEVSCGKIHCMLCFGGYKKRKKEINMMGEEINDGSFFLLVQNKMEEDDLLLPIKEESLHRE